MGSGEYSQYKPRKGKHMASSDDEFKYESVQDTELITEYLEALKEGFGNGKLLFGTRQKKLILEPNGLLKLSINAKRKDRKVKINLKISWNEGKSGKDSSAEPLEIKAGKA